MPVTLSDAFVASDDVAFREIDHEIVLLDLSSGSYFGLNAVGTRAWALVLEGRTLADVHATMLGEYDVAADQLQRDLLEWAEHLVAKGLLRTPSR